MKNSKNRSSLVFTLSQPYFWPHIYYWKVHKSSTHKYLYTNTHKICGPKLSSFLQPSLRWILKKEQRSWLPHNLKYVGKIGYRTLHPSFFFHFLDAKATLCWPNKNVDTMLTLRLFLKNISPSHVLSRKEQSYPFFLWQIHKVLLSRLRGDLLKVTWPT